MNTPRKVFVASSLQQDDINAKYQLPNDKFARTTDPEEAEFIIFDLSNLPDDWLSYFGKKEPMYIPKRNIPVLFAALSEDIAPQFTDIKKLYKGLELPVYKTPAELFNTLQWLEAIFPFYNEKMASNLEQIQKAISHIVLTGMKGIPGE